MPLTLTEIFHHIAFARNTIAEVKGDEGLCKDLTISSDGKRISKADVFDPLTIYKRWLFFKTGTVSIPTVMTLIAESGEVFPTAEGDDLLEQGAITLRPQEEPPCVEFVIRISSKLCNLESPELLLLRTRTFGFEFLSGWLMYEELQRELLAKTADELADTTREVEQKVKTRIIPEYHAEPWAVNRLVCPPAELADILQQKGVSYTDLVQIVLYEGLAFPTNFRDSAVLASFLARRRIDFDCVWSTLITCLHENTVRIAMKRHGKLADKPTLEIEDLKASLDSNRPSRRKKSLHDFWRELDEECGLRYLLGKELPDWKERAIRVAENGIYWAERNKITWGRYFMTADDELFRA